MILTQCKDTNDIENTQIYFHEIYENTQIYIEKSFENTQIWMFESFITIITINYNILSPLFKGDSYNENEQPG